MVQNRSVLDIPVFHKIYDLYKLIHSLYPGIPKAQRYTLWQKCENTTLHLLELLIETSHFKDEKRAGHLHQMSHKLDLLKVLIRLAKETHIINQTKYIEIQTNLQEIGRMLGGWLKFASPLGSSNPAGKV